MQTTRDPDAPDAPGASEDGGGGGGGDADPSALPLDEARRRMLGALTPVEGTEDVRLGDARGRTLARDVDSATDVPPFRASAMDGYAVRTAGVGGTLRVVAASLAGHPAGNRLGASECVRVTTGARVPDDADAVVQQENVERDGDEVRVLVAPSSGRHVRDAGSDSRRGERLVAAGTRLRASSLAVLAAHGVATVRVRRVPRVGLLSTGDELVEPGERLGPGAVHDANRTLLAALLADTGVEVVDLGIVADRPEALVDALARSDGVDAWVSSGGVSVGEADHVRDVLGTDGRVEFWKVAMKPGRPLAFGRVRGRPWFGLPGNPVSAAVTTLLLLRPAMAVLCGHEPTVPRGLEARVEGALSKVPGRLEFQRGTLRVAPDGARHVSSAGLQESHGLRALQRANCLVELPADSRGAAAGDVVVVHPFESFSDSPL